MTDLTVANEILNQLGGKRFVVMTGVQNLAGDANSLQMKLRRNKSKAQYLKVTLTSMDDYKVEFTRLTRNHRLETVESFEGVYNDKLQEVFTSVTGMHTKL